MELVLEGTKGSKRRERFAFDEHQAFVAGLERLAPPRGRSQEAGGNDCQLAGPAAFVGNTITQAKTAPDSMT